MDRKRLSRAMVVGKQKAEEKTSEKMKIKIIDHEEEMQQKQIEKNSGASEGL